MNNKSLFFQALDKFKEKNKEHLHIKVLYIPIVSLILIYISFTISYWILLIAIFFTILTIFMVYGWIKDFFEIYNRLSKKIENLSDGKHKLKEKEINTKNGKLHGNYKEYSTYSSSEDKKKGEYLKIECNYKDGVLDGIFKEFYENGVTKWQLNYEGGFLIGESILYNENGIILSEYDYTGDSVFDCTEYYENGNKRMVKESLDDNYRFIFYYENGIKACEIINNFFYYGDRIFTHKIRLGNNYEETFFSGEIKNSGTWINYNKKGEIEYKLKFSSKNKSKDYINSLEEVEKVNYDDNGKVSSSYFLKYKYLKEACLRFMSQYSESRLLYSGISYCTGIIGNPKKYFQDINIPIVYDLEDILDLIDDANSNKKDNLEIYKEQIDMFINEMKKIPDWYQIIQARGNGHEMGKSMGIKVDDYEYWANAHKEEYILKYNDGTLDIEGINLRIEKFGFIVTELEKVIKKAAELNLNITHEMHNDYCAARASVLGAEYALKEMTK